MQNVGIRVVRGPNWSWVQEDGGEGSTGILRAVNIANKTAVVQWDNGNKIECRIGCLDKYDIRILDNAQIGVVHYRVICDACNSDYICGIRYKCLNCCDYDLCSLCYHNDEHDLSHSFRRIETPQSLGIILPPRLKSRKCELRGIFKGALVTRGADWEWKNQDGGIGKPGRVLDIKGWKEKSYRSIVKVQWLYANTESYRLGHKGFCDIQYIEASSGGFYYPEHLPILGQTEEQMEWNQILDAIEIEQVQQLEKMQNVTVEVNKGNVVNVTWEMEKRSTLAQLGSTEAIYASKVMDYNSGINTGAPKANLVNELSAIVCELQNNEVNEIWEMMKFMSQLPEISPLENIVEARYGEKFIGSLVSNGKKYLEYSFKTYMSDIVNKNASQLSIGQVAQTFTVVRDFVGLRFQEEYLGFQDGLIEGRPLWPMVYYCIRIGDLVTAISCLECSTLVFSEILSILKAKLNTSDDASIGVLEENIRFSYRTVVRNETDPFKRTVWALLGRYDELSEVIKTVDDYIWFKLHIHNDVNQYASLQNMILEEKGESFYDAVNKPLSYFKLLVLTGQFEAAIDFLFRTEQFKIEGVHIAVALNEMNLLLLSQDSTLPLLSVDLNDPKPARRLNFALLIKSYVSKFEKDCLNGALHYFFLLRNCTNARGKSLFKTFVSDLAVSTKEYEKIFGKLVPNGHKTPGLLDQFQSVNLKVGTVAEHLIRKELYEEAIDLYDAVNDMDGVLSVMCLILSNVAHLENQTGNLRCKFLEKIIVFEERLAKDIHETAIANVVSFLTKLRGILMFFDSYRAKEYTDAFMELRCLQIVPLKPEEVEERLENLKNYNTDFCKVLPHILLAEMTILLDQCDKAKKSSNEFMRDDCPLRSIREHANCTINFAERLPHKIIGNVPNRLIQMLILMH